MGGENLVCNTMEGSLAFFCFYQMDDYEMHTNLSEGQKIGKWF